MWCCDAKDCNGDYLTFFSFFFLSGFGKTSTFSIPSVIEQGLARQGAGSALDSKAKLRLPVR